MKAIVWFLSATALIGISAQGDHVTCTLHADNYLGAVYVDGKVSQSNLDAGTLDAMHFRTGSWKGGPLTVQFPSSTRRLAILAADAESGCDRGGLIIKCATPSGQSKWDAVDCLRKGCPGRPSWRVWTTADEASWRTEGPAKINDDISKWPTLHTNKLCGAGGKFWLFVAEMVQQPVKYTVLKKHQYCSNRGGVGGNNQYSTRVDHIAGTTLMDQCAAWVWANKACSPYFNYGAHWCGCVPKGGSSCVYQSHIEQTALMITMAEPIPPAGPPTPDTDRYSQSKDKHCNGASIALDGNGDRTPYGWSPPDRSPQTCEQKCTTDPKCAGFVWRVSDKKCFWKSGTLKPSGYHGHDCYQKTALTLIADTRSGALSCAFPRAGARFGVPNVEACLDFCLGIEGTTHLQLHENHVCACYAGCVQTRSNLYSPAKLYRFSGLQDLEAAAQTFETLSPVRTVALAAAAVAVVALMAAAVVVARRRWQVTGQAAGDGHLGEELLA